MSSADLLVTSVTPLLSQLHWLKASERIRFKLTVLVYKYP